jgi:putative transposase
MRGYWSGFVRYMLTMTGSWGARASGKTCAMPGRFGRHSVARLMRRAGLQGPPQRRSWRKKSSGPRPNGTRNHLDRDFSATTPNTKWVTDITSIRTTEHWLYLCVVLDLYSGLVVGGRWVHARTVSWWSKLCSWRCGSGQPAPTQIGVAVYSEEYQRFLEAHQVISSMSAVGSCADNAAAESFFGVLKRERVNRHHYRTRAEARADIFDYIERCHNPRQRRRLEMQQQGEKLLTHLSVETG